MRNAQALADGGQFGLVGDVFGEGAGPRRQQVPGGEFGSQAVHREGARVIHRDQYGGPGNPGGHSAQHRGDLRGGRAGRRRWVRLRDKARSADGTSRGIGDEVHLHTCSAERAYGPESSVVKGVPVDAQQYGGDPGVEIRHGFFLRIGKRPGGIGTDAVTGCVTRASDHRERETKPRLAEQVFI